MHRSVHATGGCPSMPVGAIWAQLESTASGKGPPVATGYARRGWSVESGSHDQSGSFSFRLRAVSSRLT